MKPQLVNRALRADILLRRKETSFYECKSRPVQFDVLVVTVKIDVERKAVGGGSRPD